MSGTVKIARAIFDHEFFSKEPMTEREAWIWMIMEASWKPRTRRVGDYIVQTERGQLAASVRFMASAWDWTPAKVQRFLKRLISLDMIKSKTDTGVTVITICKYEEYQDAPKSADTGPIQVRYRSDTNEKKYEIREEEERGKPLSVRASRFEEFWDAYPHKGGSKRGKKPAQARYAAAVKRGVPEQTIIDGAIRARGDPQVRRGYVRNPDTWLSQEGWTDEIQPYPPETPKGPKKDGWTDAWQSALADARVADRQGDGSVVPLLHPGNRSGGGESASGGLVRYPVGRAAGGR